MLERPDLTCKTGITVCSDGGTYLDDVLRAFHRTVDAARLHRVRTVFLLFALGGELVNMPLALP